MEIAQLAAAIATAAATLALVWVTYVLAKETARLSDLSSRPMVVAALEPSAWSLIHIELIVENSGNGAAFDIEVSIEPEITQAKVRSGESMPLKKVSLLRPAQAMRSYLCEASAIIEQEFVVNVSWRRQPTSAERETITYTYDMRNLANLTRLGAFSPEVQIAEQIKKFREDWRAVAGGTRKINVNTYSEAERQAEKHDLREAMEKLRPEESGG